MSIEKYISPFIAQQFPSFYRDEGQNFIAFVKAYYEWLEEQGNTINESRSMLKYLDIDTTNDLFLSYFKNTFINSLPNNVVSDKKFLMKHILDLYRSKGTKRSYELLFRLVYNQDIEVFVPNEFIFKPSDNTWKVPTYIEITDHPKLSLLKDTIIRNSNGSTAIVESVEKRIIDCRQICILELSNVKGNFTRGDIIYQYSGQSITINDNIMITGSLNSVGIIEGGSNYNVGDILNILGSGVEAKAKVTSVISDFSGSVNFLLLNGGSGYTTNAVVTVKKTLNIEYNSLSGDFLVNQNILDTQTNANGTIVFANSSLIQLIDFSENLSFNVNDTITSSAGSAKVTRVTGGTGSGATFVVGAIKDTSFISLNTDFIYPYENLALDLTNWGFPSRPSTNTNLNTVISDALTINTFEIGTIDYLSRINPGTQYSTKVYIDVTEPNVAALNEPDGSGGIRGRNAVVDSRIISGNGVITSVEVIDSGFGYLENETLTLQTENNQSAVQGVPIIYNQGKGSGRWLNRKSFSSDDMKLQDGVFYQNFSYEIVAEKMLNTYEQLVRNLVHTSGLALYGRYRLTDVLLDDESTLVETSIT